MQPARRLDVEEEPKLFRAALTFPPAVRADEAAAECRKNRRLRAVIDELREQGRRNRHDLDVQFTRLAQLQAEVDPLKGGTKP